MKNQNGNIKGTKGTFFDGGGYGQFTEVSELTWDDEDEMEFCDECNSK